METFILQVPLLRSLWVDCISAEVHSFHEVILSIKIPSLCTGNIPLPLSHQASFGEGFPGLQTFLFQASGYCTITGWFSKNLPDVLNTPFDKLSSIAQFGYTICFLPEPYFTLSYNPIISLVFLSGWVFR